MSIVATEPPFVLGSARVVVFAILDESVTFTGKITVYVNGELLGQVPRLAVCENLVQDDDFLLYYCDEGWNVLGISAFPSAEAAMRKAERGYIRVTEKWRSNRQLSKRELAFVEEVRSFEGPPVVPSDRERFRPTLRQDLSPRCPRRNTGS